MKIGSHLNNLPLEQKREPGKNAPKIASGEGKRSADSAASNFPRSTAFTKIRRALKSMDPSDLHKVEQLRSQVKMAAIKRMPTI